MSGDHYDVLVIGSGPGGASVAARVAETGKRVLILERGDFLPRERDNWDSQAVFGNAKYTADVTFYDRHDRPFRRDHGRFRDRNVDRERPMDSRPQPPLERSHEPVAEGGGERRREKFQPTHEQPDFLRRPVRRARSESEAPLTAPGKDEPSRD